jgi:aspartyl-tRNA(Asn)/glutamyl-tRNA(Gln) amidotransferase subunit A
MTEIQHETIERYVAALRAGELRIPQAIETYLRRIEERNGSLRALLHVMDEAACQRAAALQSRVDRGDWPGPLTGVPIVVKDNILVRDHPTTAGSRILERFCPIYDATAVRGLHGAGAIVIGKANLDEFAMGSSSEFSAFGTPRNPYDAERVPGGSSGGSAAAVAGGLALGALGSDTGGSVRQPAAFCGLVALKPQYGSVSRYGLIAFGSSLDQIGPMARTARDCALLQNAISGPDPQDATCLAERRPIRAERLGEGPRQARFGVPRGWVDAGLDPAVRGAFGACCERFAGLGAHIVPVTLPDPELGVAAYYVLANAEASSNLARYDGVRFGLRAAAGETFERLQRDTRGVGFGPEVKRRILIGTYVLSAGYYDAYYQKALEVRGLIRAAYAAVFREVDFLLMPVTPTPAFRRGEKLTDPLAMYLCDLFTIPANLTGSPAVAFPIGESPEGLPIGAQLCGPAQGEEGLLGWVHCYSEGCPFPLPEQSSERKPGGGPAP